MNPFLLLAQEFTKRFGEDVGKSADAVASGDIKKIAGTAYDTFAPIPVQAALYSPEAEAAFIGPQGMARLKAAGLGDKMKEFTSRFFGQRAEINPTDTDLVIQAMMGGPHAVAKAKVDDLAAWAKGRSDILNRRNELETLEELAGWQRGLAAYDSRNPAPANLVAADFLTHFPELVIAYPRLKELPVAPNFTYNSKHAAKYEPTRTIREGKLTFPGLDAEEAFYRANSTSRFDAPPELRLRGEKVNKAARMHAEKRSLEATRTGGIDINLTPNNSAIPGIDSYDSILHEIQHFIQREEAGMGKEHGQLFLDLYRRQKDTQPYNYDRLADKMHERKGQLRKTHMEERRLADDKIDAADRIIREKQAAGKLTDDQASKLLNSVIDQANKQDSRAYSNYVYATNKYQREDLPMHEKNWDYNMNPFEREAYESARRDTDPAYRKKYSRKTEVIK